MRKLRGDLDFMCETLIGANDCANTNCAGKRLNTTLPAQDNFWLAYMYLAHDAAFDIGQGLLATAFYWDEIEDIVANLTAGRTLADDDSLVEWAKPFGKYCAANFPKGWNASEIVQYVPMNNDGDLWGAAGVNFEIGLLNAFFEVWEATKWNTSATLQYLSYGMDKHCIGVQLAVGSIYEAAIANNSYTEVGIKIGELSEKIVSAIVNKTGQNTTANAIGKQLYALMLGAASNCEY